MDAHTNLVKIKVLQEDIDAAREDSVMCPIDQALFREGYAARVLADEITFMTNNFLYTKFKTPPEIKEKIIKWDTTKEMEPFEFELVR